MASRSDMRVAAVTKSVARLLATLTVVAGLTIAAGALATPAEAATGFTSCVPLTPGYSGINIRERCYFEGDYIGPTGYHIYERGYLDRGRKLWENGWTYIGGWRKLWYEGTDHRWHEWFCQSYDAASGTYYPDSC